MDGSFNGVGIYRNRMTAETGQKIWCYQYRGLNAAGRGWAGGSLILENQKKYPVPPRNYFLGKFVFQYSSKRRQWCFVPVIEIFVYTKKLRPFQFLPQNIFHDASLN